MLTEEERADMRERLLFLRAELVGDTNLMAEEALKGDSKEGAGFLSNVPQHMADKGSDFFEQAFTLSRLENATDVIVKVDDALDRLDGEGYGECEDCDAEIPLRRLRIKPYATMCVPCREKYEEEGGE